MTALNVPLTVGTFASPEVSTCRPPTYSGCATTCPSAYSVHLLPNRPDATPAVVSAVSSSVAPVRALLYRCVSTSPACACQAAAPASRPEGISQNEQTLRRVMSGHFVPWIRDRPAHDPLR